MRQSHPEQGGLRFLMRMPGKCLAGLVLVHGLVSLPLLVVCIPIGGRPVVELAGHDTCHADFADHFERASQGSDLPSIFGPGRPFDPCLDISMFRPAISQSADAPAAPGAAADLFGASEARLPASRDDSDGAPVREQLFLPLAARGSCGPLRI
jgi:hypothetical protein